MKFEKGIYFKTVVAVGSLLLFEGGRKTVGAKAVCRTLMKLSLGGVVFIL
jgi:hypothetical protein